MENFKIIVLCLSAFPLLSYAVRVPQGLPADPVKASHKPDMEDSIVKNPGEERFQYIRDKNGELHLFDMSIKESDLKESARYEPDTENKYLLYTRDNPSQSQPLVWNNSELLWASNFDSEKRTAVLLHGWRDDTTADIFNVLVPAFLAAEDMNVIFVDWSAGAGTIKYPVAVLNTVTSGKSVASFLNWLTSKTGATFDKFHIAGHSLGAQQAGIIGRNLASPAAYITGLDPAQPGWVSNPNRFRAADGEYTEVIHTNAGDLGFLTRLGHVDFYPNGGMYMPGCTTPKCHHERSFHYLGESVKRGGFSATKCRSYVDATMRACSLPGTLNMGGITPKTGKTGVYYLETNEAPPYSQDK